MSIKTKFGILFFISLALVVGFGFYLLSINEEILSKRKRFSLSYQQVVLLISLKEKLQAAVSESSQVINFNEDPDEYFSNKKSVDKIIDQMFKKMTEELTFIHNKEKEEEEEEESSLKLLSQKVNSLFSEIDSILQDAENSSSVKKDRVEKLYEITEQSFEDEIIALIEDIIREEKDELKKIEEKELTLARKARFWTFMEVGIMIFVFLFIFTYLIKALIRPILSLEEASEKIGENDFTVDLPFESNDEVGKLTKTFLSMSSRIQQNLGEIRTYLASIVEHSNDAIIGKDLNGNILSWNKGAEKIYGYSEDQVKGKKISLIVPEEKINELDEILEKVKHGIPVENLETLRITSDGSILEILLNISPIKDDLGNVVGVSTIARNISSIKETQRGLIEARNVAEKANQAKSEFLARMSHELRTPMNAILGFGQLLKIDCKKYDDSALDDSTNRILSAGKHLLDLINEVLDLAQIESGKLKVSLEPVNVIRVKDELIELLGPLSKNEQIEIIDKIDNKAQVFVTADQTRLKQVILEDL